MLSLKYYKNRIEEKIVEKVCIPMMTSYARKGSDILNHFISENKRIAHNELEQMAVEDAKKILSLISVTDQTPYSINQVLDMVKGALQFKLLSPLTFEDSEFREIDPQGLKQSTRRASVFKQKDGTVRDIDSIMWDVTATAVIKNGELVKKLWKDEYSRYSTGLAFMYELDADKNVVNITPVESQAKFINFKDYYGEEYKIKAFEVLDITNEDKTGVEIYTLFNKADVCPWFYDRFEFIDIRTDDSVYDKMKKMVEEDLKTVTENDFIGKYEYLSFGPEDVKRADDENSKDEEERMRIYYDDKEFVWNDYVYDDLAQKLIGKLIDAEIDERNIKVILDDQNRCVCVEVFYEDGTQYDTIADIIEKEGIALVQKKVE